MIKILIIGGHGSGKTALCQLLVQHLKAKYGNDIRIFTPKEAKELQMKMEDFANTTTMKIEARPEMFIPKITVADLANSHPFQKFIGKPKYKKGR